MSNYKIMFAYSKEDNCYITFVPSLPGCMADGKSIDEAVANTQVIISEWLETAVENGREIPVDDYDHLQLTGASIKDVAGYILHKCGSITGMAIEKMTYYCRAWSLAWYDKSLFPERFQAWAHGPVCRTIFNIHRGQYIVSESDFPNTHVFSDSELWLMNSVLDVYLNYSAEQLSEMTHAEDPWRLTRGDLPENAVCSRIISDEMIKAYYGKWCG